MSFEPLRWVALVAVALTALQAETTIALFGSGRNPNEHDTATAKDKLVGGKSVAKITGVTSATMTFFPAPESHNTGAGVLVFPGGGYRILAYDLEGTEVCGWLNSAGVNCVLVKYRVPDAGPFPEHAEDLADAQRAMRLTRLHAKEWHIDPARLGVLGFSAGAHLAAVLGNEPTQATYKSTDEADKLSSIPAFVILIYPGLIVKAPNLEQPVSSAVVPKATTPPTFLVQAEDDPVHVENSTVYYQGLKKAGVKAEMHLFAEGGHGYGLRPTELPITHWPKLAERWLETIHVLSTKASD